MIKNFFIILLTILILFFIIIHFSKSKVYKFNNYIILNTECPENKQYKNIFNNYIPKILHQTYKSRDIVPNKVFSNIKKYASDYEYRFYDDKDCIDFLTKYFHKNVINAYNHATVTAHKADLFRYCLLYIYGGIYLDIKTELIKPLNEIFTDNYIYSVLSINKNTIYQGIIATPPRNNFFLILINNFINIIYRDNIDYLVFTRDFYNEIKKDLNENIVKNGLNTGKYNTYYLFTENCDKTNKCYDGLDRHKFCCYVMNGNNTIIKSRYSDFPWK
jgi:hypothetical protein